MPVTRFDPPGDDEVPQRRGGHGHGRGDDMLKQASELLGFDVVETKIVESNRDLHLRVVERLSKPAALVPAEQVFGPLDE